MTEAPQGSVQAEGQYGTAAGDETAEAPADYAAILDGIALRTWRRLLLFFLRMRVAQLTLAGRADDEAAD